MRIRSPLFYPLNYGPVGGTLGRRPLHYSGPLARLAQGFLGRNQPIVSGTSTIVMMMRIR